MKMNSPIVGQISEQQHSGLLVVAAVILFVATLIVMIIPVHVIEYYSSFQKDTKKRSKRQQQETLSSSSQDSTEPLVLPSGAILSKDRVIQFLTQAGGGVLLYTAFIHMLPEIRESYTEYLNSTTTHGFFTENRLPLVDLCACVGFFGIFFIEELTHSLFLKDHHHHHHKKHDKHAKEPDVVVLGAQQYQRHVDEEGGDLKL